VLESHSAFLSQFLRPLFAHRFIIVFPLDGLAGTRNPIAILYDDRDRMMMGLAGPGMPSYIVTGKFNDHLPYRRLEDIFAQQGFEISTGPRTRQAIGDSAGIRNTLTFYSSWLYM
jgi:hypothetical protein